MNPRLRRLVLCGAALVAAVMAAAVAATIAVAALRAWTAPANVLALVELLAWCR